MKSKQKVRIRKKKENETLDEGESIVSLDSVRLPEMVGAHYIGLLLSVR